jgi:hypothetical protein
LPKAPKGLIRDISLAK